MNNTQISRVERTLRETGEVTRNQFLDLPTDKITRLGAVICLLRKQGWDIKTFETKKDTIYRVTPKRTEYYNVLLPDGTKEPYTKTIWH